MATSELRDRVRTRLVDTERAIARARVGVSPDPAADPVTALLATGDPAEVTARHERLRTAVADFDVATITTIHGFCMNALDALGLGRDLTFLDDVRDLVDETIDDLFLSRAAAAPGRDLLLADARAAGRAAAFDPFAELAGQRTPDSVPGLRTSLRRGCPHRIRGQKAAPWGPGLRRPSGPPVGRPRRPRGG